MVSLTSSLRLSKTSKFVLHSACTEVPRNSELYHLSRPDDHCDEESQNLREFVALKNNFIDVNVMEKGISAMADNPSGNFKALYDVVADKRTVEFSITEKPNAVNSSGELSKDLVVFGPTAFFPEDTF